MREVHARFGAAVQIVLYPVAAFGNQELPTDAQVLAFVADKGPEGVLVMKLSQNLTDRPSWWTAVQPKWNFEGKWLVGKDGEMTADVTASNLIQELAKRV